MNKCKQCQSETLNPKFCNKSCSASYNNVARCVDRFCLMCSSTLPRGRREAKYCNQVCQQDYQRNYRVKNGTAGHSATKTYIEKERGKICSCCGLTSWLGSPITLELEHINGDSDNHSLDNVCLLCPNCHSQTPTYKAKNKGNGRHLRRKRYKEGKSY